jgi:NTE family protein
MTPKPKPPVNPPGEPRLGLVLGSGGARGVVHIAVLEALLEMGVRLDLIAGSSIGAVVGAVYVSGALEACKKDLAGLRKDDLLRLFDPVLSLSGLFTARKTMLFLERYVPRSAKIENCSPPLGIVATDYETGHPIVFRQGNLLEAVRASMSIPGIFTPARIRGSMFIDGGVSDPLPLDVARSMGAERTIAVSLQPAIGKIGILPGPPLRAHRLGRLADHLPGGLEAGEKGWLKEAELWLASGKPAAGNRERHPNIFEILFRAIDIMGYANTMMMLTAHPPTVLIEFELPNIPTLDFTKCTELLARGREAVELKKDEIREKILAGTRAEPA